LGPFEVLLYIIALAAVLFLTWVGTRFIAGKASKTMRGKHIEIIETVALGADKKLHLIKAGDAHYLIATASKQVQLIDKIDLRAEDPGEAGAETAANVFDFKSFFDKYVGKYTGRNKPQEIISPEDSGGTAEVSPDTGGGDSGGDSPAAERSGAFRGNLERLKNITQTKKDSSL